MVGITFQAEYKTFDSNNSEIIKYLRDNNNLNMVLNWPCVSSGPCVLQGAPRASSLAAKKKQRSYVTSGKTSGEGGAGGGSGVTDRPGPGPGAGAEPGLEPGSALMSLL